MCTSLTRKSAPSHTAGLQAAVNEHGNIDFSQLITLGLITADEASQLTPTMTTGMMRDYAISWAQQTVYKMWENGHMISTEVLAPHAV